MRLLPQVTHRLRLSSKDAHYAGNLVDGARILNLFGDVATELTIKFDGDEGLLRAYESVEFLSPVYAGDFVEITGKITAVGTTSRTMSFTAHKVISSTNDPKQDSAADVLPEPILVVKAVGTCVVTKDKQRKQLSKDVS